MFSVLSPSFLRINEAVVARTDILQRKEGVGIGLYSYNIYEASSNILMQPTLYENVANGILALVRFAKKGQRITDVIPATDFIFCYPRDLKDYVS